MIANIIMGFIAFSLLVLALAICLLPIVLPLALLTILLGRGSSSTPKRDHRGIKNEVVHAQWEWDRFWTRRK